MGDETVKGGWMAQGLEPATPEANYFSTKRPRISGTALVGGLHLATGNYGTAPWWRLLISGGVIVLSLSVALVMSFLELWALDQLQGTQFAVSLLGLAVATDTAWGPYAAIGLQLLPMINFLIVLRLSPLSGYHAAEHKVVAAIEAHGAINYEQVVEMPRAHPRCGTVLLFGVLPGLLVAYPLFSVQPLAAVAVAFVGWSLRYQVGYFIQQYFTTKPPTPAQLRAGIEAGRKLMALWQAEPDKQVSVARSIWTRGMPQMIAGVLAAQWLLGRLYNHLHLWLDF
jgi:hypothetical protein